MAVVVVGELHKLLARGRTSSAPCVDTARRRSAEGVRRPVSPRHKDAAPQACGPRRGTRDRRAERGAWAGCAEQRGAAQPGSGGKRMLCGGQARRATCDVCQRGRRPTRHTRPGPEPHGVAPTARTFLATWNTMPSDENRFFFFFGSGLLLWGRVAFRHGLFETSCWGRQAGPLSVSF